MIEVTIRRRSEQDSYLSSFLVEGHAQFDEPGKDLVCAAVSAITVGTVNSVETLTGVILIHEMELGLLDVTVPDLIEPEAASQVQLLLESMVVMLQTIALNYGEYIVIDTTYNEGG
jgi:uncharacterized protein